MAILPEPDTATPLHPQAQALDALAGTIEAIAEQTRAINAAEATRLELVEQARLQVRAMQDATDTELRFTGGVKFQSNELARRSLEQEVGYAMGMHERTAGSRIYCAEVLLNDFTATLQVLRSGAVTIRHCQIMVDAAIDLPEEQRSEFETLALKKAVQQTPGQFRSTVRKIKAKLHPELLEDRHRTAYDDRTTRLDPADDAMAWFTVYNSAASLHGVDNRIDEIARHLRTLPGEERTLAQLRSDVATEILLNGDIYGDIPGEVELSVRTEADTEPIRLEDGEQPSAAPTRGRYSRFRPTVHITVPVLTLLGKTDEPASLDGYGPIPLSTAAEIAACAPSFTRILTHPETGAVLSVGRDSYRVPKDLARWVRTRDGTCRQKFCNSPARRSEIDHSVPWTPQRWRPTGGQTSDDNLSSLCGGHHTGKHALLVNGWGHVVGEAWGLRHQTDATGHTTGTIIWTTPTGRQYETEPDVTMNPYRPNAN